MLILKRRRGIQLPLCIEYAHTSALLNILKSQQYPCHHCFILSLFSLQSSAEYSSSQWYAFPTGIWALPVYSCPEMMRFISEIKESTVLRIIQLVTAWKLSTRDESSNHRALPLARCLVLHMDVFSILFFLHHIFSIYASKESCSKVKTLIMNTQS